MLNEQKRFPEAETTLREAIRLKPDLTGTQQNLGIVLVEENKYAEAEAAFREAIRLKPDEPIGHAALADVLFKQGKYAEAEAAAREAIRLNSDDFSSYANLSLDLARQRKYAEAESSFREIIRLKPDYLGAYKDLSFCLYEQGKYQEAKDALSEALRLKPDHGPTMGALAWLLANCPDPQVRDLQAASEIAQKLVDGDQQSGMAWQLLGTIQYRAGAWQASINALEKSCELQTDPKGGDAGQWLFLAMAHWQLDHKDEARRWYDRALEWMEKNESHDEDFARFRAEAEALLKGDEARPKNEKLDPQSNSKPSTADQSAASNGGVSRQPGHVVEIGVVTGQVHQTVCLHDGDGESIIAQQTMLDAESSGGGDQVRRNGQNLDAQLGDVVDRLTKRIQFLNVHRLLLQAIDDFRFPAELGEASVVMSRWATSLSICVEVNPAISPFVMRSINLVHSGPSAGNGMKWYTNVLESKKILSPARRSSNVISRKSPRLP